MFMVLFRMPSEALKADKRLRCNPRGKGTLRNAFSPGSSQREFNFLGTCSAFTCVFIINKTRDGLETGGPAPPICPGFHKPPGS